MKLFSLVGLIMILLTACVQKSTEDQVVEWISANAVEFKTVEAGNGFEDLVPFGDMIGDAKIVSLGEPTHGNREVFQLKHRLIEYLVVEKGFNVFALECPFAEAYDMNRYVVNGIGDPRKALAGIYYWVWDTQEVLALVEWMRAYNANPENEEKIKFVGFDPQDPERAARVMLEYLAKVDPELEQAVRPELGILEVPFSNPEAIGRRQYIPIEYDASSLQRIKQVMEAFDKNKNRYVQSSSTEEWMLAQQHARQVELYIDALFNNEENYLVVRDLGQAQNLKWILNNEESHAKMIIWAHNSHVSNSSKWGANWMGKHMKKWYGDDIKIFGFFFNKGQFKAIDDGIPENGMYDFTVGQAPEDYLEFTIAKTGMSLAALDLNKLPQKGKIHDWFDQKRRTRNSGGGYDVNDTTRGYWEYNLVRAFDGFVYVDSTSAVIDLEQADYDFIWPHLFKIDQPANTGFEDDMPQEKPKNWLTWSRFERLGVEMTVSNENPYNGNNSGLLRREKDLAYGEIAPSLRQYIDAKPYLGKRILLRVAARAEIEDPGFAFFRLSIEPDPLIDAHVGLPPLYDNLDSCRISSKNWTIYEVETKVDSIADVIQYGIYLRDFGSVWMDDVTIEIIE